ncbi:MAG: hypothetical protein IMW89_20050 [Ktedonobacteraceae bacterium]|nr:hypothetical protein [Ktedonobacteraceae bacterium]
MGKNKLEKGSWICCTQLVRQSGIRRSPCSMLLKMGAAILAPGKSAGSPWPGGPQGFPGKSTDAGGARSLFSGQLQ